MQTERRGQNAAQEAAALFSPLAEGQGPGMPGSQRGLRTGNLCPLGFPGGWHHETLTGLPWSHHDIPVSFRPITKGQEMGGLARVTR